MAVFNWNALENHTAISPNNHKIKIQTECLQSIPETLKMFSSNNKLQAADSNALIGKQFFLQDMVKCTYSRNNRSTFMQEVWSLIYKLNKQKRNIIYYKYFINKHSNLQTYYEIL
jgi:hypothetical protein